MAPRNQLTNEKLKGLFKSDFDLANYAISLARHAIKAGREVNIDDLLLEIRRSPTPRTLAELERLDLEAEEE
jgi:hypothetical protein